MPVSLNFLRVILGLLSVTFAHFLGRTSVGLHRGQVKRSRVISWALRTVVSMLAVWYRRPDLMAVIFLILAILSAAAGVYLERRPRKEEDLTKVIFPGE